MRDPGTSQSYAKFSKNWPRIEIWWEWWQKSTTKFQSFTRSTDTNKCLTLRCRCESCCIFFILPMNHLMRRTVKNLGEDLDFISLMGILSVYVTSSCTNCSFKESETICIDLCLLGIYLMYLHPKGGTPVLACVGDPVRLRVLPHCRIFKNMLPVWGYCRIHHQWSDFNFIFLYETIVESWCRLIVAAMFINEFWSSLALFQNPLRMDIMAHCRILCFLDATKWPNFIEKCNQPF